MADDDRQPPQAYDTVAPAGVGAASSNQMSPGAWKAPGSHMLFVG